ncbi:LuxR C-terminal-related transcriptional regulator [Actinomadura sp. 6N118]|uniref:helix-turn-helix transcriptional regulator n=1 Tax=Actinomadura sp. 6N118 TaxID=3375151 RepID=UPI0037918BA4
MIAGRASTDEPATDKRREPTGSLPHLPDWVIARPRLTERVRAGVRGELTVITGPPGAGKTITALAWAANGTGSPQPITCWVACDDSTETVQGFCVSLSRSLAQAGIDVAATLQGPCDTDVQGKDMITAITAALLDAGTPIAVVVDDFPARPGTAPAEVVNHLLRHAGPGFRAVVLSRSDSPLPLHRHRLAGELTEIRADDLAFEDDEIAEVLAQHGVRLTQASQRALRERTGGWPAGIRLAAMSMEKHPDPEAFATRFAGDDQAVVGYLMEEVVDAQPPDVRRLLLSTSVVQRVNTELAGVLAGEAGRAFPDMVRQNAFVVPLGQGWYRYHHMFGEALRLILRHESPGKVPVLHQRAAAWFERSGLLLEAVRQAVQTGDWQCATRMVVDRLAIGLVLGLRPPETLSGLFEGMPEATALRSAEPEPAIVAAAVAARRGDGASCAAAVHHAKRVLRRSPRDAAGLARLCLAAVELCRPGVTAFADPASASGEAAALLRKGPGRLIDDRPELRALALSGQGAAHVWHGELPEAARLFGEALTAAEQAGGDAQMMRCLSDLALTEALLGNVARAAHLANRARRLPDVSASPEGREVAMAHLACAWGDVERWRLEEARIELGRAAQAFNGYADPLSNAIQRLVKARADLCQGRPEHALEDLRAADAIIQRPGWLERRLALVAAEAHVACGEIEAARRDAERAGGRATLESVLALARVEVSSGADGAVSAMLRDALRQSSRAPMDVLVEAWLLDACLCYRNGDRRRGRRSLHRALRLARREEIRRPFAMSRSWLLPVLDQDPEVLHSYHLLLEPLGLAVRTGSAVSPDGHGAAPVEQLSPRELEVLQSVAQLMTTEEIASTLYLSANTVKTHLKSIYRKLAVTRRGEAVRRAQELSLL